MTMQLVISNGLIVLLLTISLAACVNIKQSVSTTERVRVTGTLSRESLLGGVPVWTLRPNDASILLIRDSLLRGTAAIQGVYVVNRKSPLANPYHGEFPAATLAEHEECDEASFRGELRIGRLVTPEMREMSFRVILCISE
jgi:hypothetical protein